MYPFLRNIMFCFPPENVHYFSMNTLKLVCKNSSIKNLISNQFIPKSSGLSKTVFGLTFKIRLVLVQVLIRMPIT